MLVIWSGTESSALSTHLWGGIVALNWGSLFLYDPMYSSLCTVFRRINPQIFISPWCLSPHTTLFYLNCCIVRILNFYSKVYTKDITLQVEVKPPGTTTCISCFSIYWAFCLLATNQCSGSATVICMKTFRADNLNIYYHSRSPLPAESR